MKPGRTSVHKRTELSPKGENTRERILKMSRDMFLDHGYDELVLRRIAESLDMKLSNVQYYFKTKDDLVGAIIEGEERRDLSILREALDRFESGEEIVRYIVPKFLEHWRSRAGIIFAAREFFAVYKPAIHLTKQETDAIFFDEMENLVIRMNPALDKAEVRRRRRLIVCVLDGAGIQADPGPRNQFNQSVEDLVISIAMA